MATALTFCFLGHVSRFRLTSVEPSNCPLEVPLFGVDRKEEPPYLTGFHSEGEGNATTIHFLSPKKPSPLAFHPFLL